MGSASAPFASNLFSMCLLMTKDDDAEVRSNAVYALGVVCFHNVASMSKYALNSLHFDHHPSH